MLRAIAARAGLACAGTSVVILLLEAVLRLTTAPTFLQRDLDPSFVWRVYDPVLGTTNKPGFAGNEFRINALGMRGEEVTVRKPAGTIRIVCLGDSSTFGIYALGPGAFGFESYVDALAELLRARGRSDVQVINAGVMGTTTACGLRKLVTDIVPLAPDIVTIRYGMTDHGFAARPELLPNEPRSPLGRRALAVLARWRIGRLVLHARTIAPLSRPPPWSERTVPPDAFARNLHDFAAVAREHGFRLLFIDYPLRVRGGRPATLAGRLVGASTIPELLRLHAEYQAIVRRVAAAAAVPFLETAPALADAAEPAFSDYDLVHPNAAGARLTAELLLEQLEALHWLDR